MFELTFGQNTLEKAAARPWRLTVGDLGRVRLGARLLGHHRAVGEVHENDDIDEEPDERRRYDDLTVVEANATQHGGRG